MVLFSGSKRVSLSRQSISNVHTKTDIASQCIEAPSNRPSVVAISSTQHDKKSADTSSTNDTDRSTVNRSIKSVSTTRETAVYISPSEDVSPIEPQSNSSVDFPPQSRHGSSLELFSSGSTTTANDSVILLSGVSVTSDEQKVNVRPSVLAEHHAKPKETSLSAFLYNRVREPKSTTHLQSSANSAQTTAKSNVSSQLFSSHCSDEHLIVMEIDQYAQSGTSTPVAIDSDNDELSGNTSDECEDFLSNRAYLLRKRKCRKDTTASEMHSKPSLKRTKYNRQLVGKKTRGRRKHHSRKKRKSQRYSVYLHDCVPRTNHQL